jgi:hypothetical protein
MLYRQYIPLVALLSFLSGCAAVIEGTTQDIEVTTIPPGASCNFLRDGQQLGSILTTPGSFHVDKTKDDLTISCQKPGIGQGSLLDASGYPKYNWLYILVGGPIGWGYDSAVGADNLYQSPVQINLAH